MFERFSDGARRVVVLAQEEARHLGHNYIGTEHILLGLVKEGDGSPARALAGLGVTLDGLREQIELVVGHGDEAAVPGHIPFTPRAKKVLELSLREAIQLSEHDIDTKHLMLAIIREGQGVAAQVLVERGIDLPSLRNQLLQPTPGPAPRSVAWKQTAEIRALRRLFDDPDSLSCQVLTSLGVDLDAVNRKLRELGLDEGA